MTAPPPAPPSEPPFGDPALDRFVMHYDDVVWPEPTADDVANAQLLLDGNIAVTGPGGTAILTRGSPAWTRYAKAMALDVLLNPR